MDIHEYQAKEILARFGKLERQPGDRGNIDLRSEVDRTRIHG
jgi:succinyl-CoA synthetase beta subunit